jgi:hypothetical protein
MSQKVKINAVVYKEGDLWIAQGIEYDIVARANYPDGVPAAFAKAVANTAQVSVELGGEPFAGISKAPARFQLMFDRAQTRIVPIHTGESSNQAANVDMRLAQAS